MLFILHGENQTASREALQKELDALKKQSPHSEILHLDGNALTETGLVEALESPSMFTSDRIIHIDGLLSRRPSKEKTHVIERMVSSLSQLSILIWEGKQLTAAQCKPFQKLKNCKIQEFKFSKTLFIFLDSLKPGNASQMVALLDSTLKSEPPELVMFMLVRRVAELLLATSHDPRALDGIRTPWQKDTLLRQSKHWSQSQLLGLHRSLLGIDEAVKTGATAADVRTHLDILLTSL